MLWVCWSDKLPGEVYTMCSIYTCAGINIHLCRLQGCHVVGITGSEEKRQYLTQELGFHAAINYNKGNVKVTQEILRRGVKGVPIMELVERGISNNFSIYRN